MFLAGDGESGHTAPVCGICALDLSNEHHGVSRTHFTGQIAEGMRRDALKWRQTHPVGE